MSKFLQKNVGPEDRAIRIVLGIVFLASGLSMLAGYGVFGVLHRELCLAAFGGTGATIVGWAVAVLGAIGIVTGATGRCPTYVLLGGISTLHEPAGERTATGSPVGSH